MAWLAEILGLPASAEGLLTSGGSMANFTALATARRARAPGVREDGFAGTPPLVVYVSDEVHNCVDKAVDLLGIGWKQLRKVPTDDRFRIRVDLLKQAIAADRKAGLKPAIVVGNAGHREHRRDRPARRARRPLRGRGPLVPRGRGLRGDGLDLAEAEAALRRPRAGRLRRRRPAQVALRALRGRRHPRPRARADGRGLPPPGPLPRPRPRQPGPRAGPLQRARPGALARLQGPQGVGGPEAPREEGLRRRGRARRGDGALPGRRGRGRARTSSCWPSRCCRSSGFRYRPTGGRPGRGGSRPAQPAASSTGSSEAGPSSSRRRS